MKLKSKYKPRDETLKEPCNSCLFATQDLIENCEGCYFLYNSKKENVKKELYVDVDKLIVEKEKEITRLKDKLRNEKHQKFEDSIRN